VIFLDLEDLLHVAGLNAGRLTMTNDEAYDVVMAGAAGSVEDVDQIAQLLAAGSESA